MAEIQNLQRYVDWVNMGIVITLALSFLFGATSIFLSRNLNKAKLERGRSVLTCLQLDS